MNGNKFLAVFRVYDSEGKILDFIQADSEFSAVFTAVKRGHLAVRACVHRIINL